MTDGAYRLALAPAARRVLTESPPVGLPVSVATAMIGFVTGPLVEDPYRVGKPLANELAGHFSARRGGYRVVYRIDDQTHTVRVVRIDHRSDVYRS